MKQTRHSIMAKGIMVLLSLLVLIFAITYSWYSLPRPVPAAGLTVNTSTGSDFEYAIGFRTSQTFGNYLVTDFTNASTSSLDIEHLTVPDMVDENDDPIEYNLLYDYNPIDITGNGYTLVRPAMEYGNWKINTGTTDYSIAEANTQYISFDLIIRSKSYAVLSLGPQSYAKGEAETHPGDGGLLSTSVRKSDYGNFSKDAIVGAVRVAFLEFDNSQQDITTNDLLTLELSNKLSTTPSLVWLPRPDIYLNNNNRDDQTTGWSLNTHVNSTDTFNLQSQAMNDSTYSTYQHQYYNIFNNSSIQVVDDLNAKVSSLDDESDNNSLVHFNQTSRIGALSYSRVESGTEYFYAKIRVRIWIEGTDTESRRALSGGKFSVNFDLTTN